MGALTGLLAGINQTADENRQRVRDQELQQERFERAELQRIAGDENYTQDIRERAATSLMEIAANPTRRQKGSFTDRLLGVNRIEAHPSITNLMRFMQTPEMKGQLPTGLRQTSAPNPSAAGAVPPPTSAAMPPTPAGQAGGGPPSVSALGSPGGGTSPVGGMGIVGPTPTQGGEIGGMPVGPRATGATPGVAFPGMPGQAAQPPPQVDDGLPDGPLPGVNEATGAGPQGQTAGMPVPRRIMRTPAEIAIETAKAKSRGDLEGEIEALSTIMPREQVVELIKLRETNKLRGSVAGQTYAEGNTYQDANGNWVQDVYLRSDPSKRMQIPAVAPSARSVSAPTDEAQVAAELFESRYPEHKGNPAGLLRAISPTERAVLAQTMQRRTAAQQGMNTSARMGAEAAGPLSTGQRADKTLSLQDDWRKADAKTKTMREQASVMDTAVARFPADPTGASEAFRTAYITMFDPNATVREGDYVRLGLGLSLANRIEGYLQNLSSGGGNIPLPTMQAMAETAKTVAARAQAWTADEAARIDATAKEFGINPALIRGVAATPPPSIADSPGTFNAPARPSQTTPPAASPQGAAGQGGPPTIPATVPAGAPVKGAQVGNPEYDVRGGVSRSKTSGTLYGMVNGQRVELYEENGKYFVMGPA